MKRPCYWCGSYSHHLNKTMLPQGTCVDHLRNLLLDALFGGGERGRYAKRRLNLTAKRDASLMREAMTMPERSET